MGMPAAKEGDQIVATDLHKVLIPGGGIAFVPLPFAGQLNGGLSSNVKIMSKPAATVDSTADNSPAHVAPPGTSFPATPANKGTVKLGSATVKINGKSAARSGDIAETCNDPDDLPVGVVMVDSSTVMIG